MLNCPILRAVFHIVLGLDFKLGSREPREIELKQLTKEEKNNKRTRHDRRNVSFIK
jgi:hypothetical protein